MLLAEKVVSLLPKHLQWQASEGKGCGHHIPGALQWQDQDSRNHP